MKYILHPKRYHRAVALPHYWNDNECGQHDEPSNGMKDIVGKDARLKRAKLSAKVTMLAGHWGLVAIGPTSRLRDGR